MLQVITRTVERTDQAVEDALIAMDITYEVHYLGERNEGDWEHDEWMFQFTRKDHRGVPIAAMRHTYRTGTGHRKLAAGARMPNPPYRPRTLAYEAFMKANLRAVRPPAAGLLCSLLRDGESSTETFQDWCGDLGYDTDSIKALKTYHECQQILITMRRFFAPGQMDTLRALLEDY